MEEFIEKIAIYVQKYAPQYGINVCSPIIAQACLESGYGTSELAIYAKNYFGLKYRQGRCKTCIGIYEKIGSEQAKNGTYVSSNMQWCKFADMESGVIGYFDFTNISNYSNLKGLTDPKEYLETIKADGYATSLNYVQNLMNVIEKWDLTKYDKEEQSLSNSSLVCHKNISPNKTVGRNHSIDTISIHCMAGNLSVESCGALFAKKSTQASSNYGIGSDGRIALYVDEKDRSWCTSSSSNDNRAVTIEVANDGGAPDWHVSAKAMASLINLCADICKRNGIKALLWKGDKSLIGKVDKQNMTVHRWFASKACPGDYLYSMHGNIANEVNKLLGSKIVNETAKTNATPVTTTIKALDYSLVFNASYYYSLYADLRKAGLNTESALLNHFKKYGMKEARIACPTFNVNAYKSYYKDLQMAFGNDMPKYYEHYIKYGYKEGRKAK